MPRTLLPLALAAFLAAPGPAQESSPPKADPPQSAAPLLRAFFEAVNSGERARILAFYEEGVTEGFRTRRSEEEDRAFYERIRGDLGTLTIEGLRRSGPTEAVATLSAEKLDLPVVFTFTLAGGKIDGIQVRVGGPPGGRPQMLELPETGSDAELAEALDAELSRLVAADRFSGVVLLARDGEPIFHRAYGLADREKSRRVTTATRFDVGSITKLLTRIAVAGLAQAGKLALDDPIARHLPAYPDPEIAARVTIQHLLDHSSGLGDIFNARWQTADRGAFVQPEEFFPLFAGEPLQFEPGSRRAYSNAGYVVLGAIVAAAAGEPYFEYVTRNVLEPAGMSRPAFPVKEGSDPALAIGYTRGGPTGGRTDATGPLRPNLRMLPIRGCPAGSSTHTAADLLALDRALRAGKLLDPEWTTWLFGSAPADAAIGVAGGGPGVSAGYESDGATTAIVLANLDPPAGSGLAIELYRTLAER